MSNLEPKNTVNEKIKTLDRINSRMKMTEKKVNVHMKIVSRNYPVICRSIEKKTEEKLRDLWDNDRGLRFMSLKFQQER